MQAELERAREALHAIPPDLPRDDWVKACMAAHAAGVPADDVEQWSAQAENFNRSDFRSMWRSIKPGKGVGAGTLYKMGAEHGWRNPSSRYRGKAKPPARPFEAPTRPRAGMSAAEVWARCEPAPARHPYIMKKRAEGVPLEGLRVVPDGDGLRIGGNSMAGALAVPAYSLEGELQSLQLIPPDGPKMNLPGCPIGGAMFAVGELAPDGVAYIVEGIGQAWACWQATGAASVVCFGAGNMGKVSGRLRESFPGIGLVLVPDVGKEAQAQAIARDVGGLYVTIPEGWEKNADVNDLAQRDGLDALELLLHDAKEPPKPEPRYKLLSSADLAALPPLAWRVRGVLPATGLAGLYGPSASGKSFLGFDLAAAISEGGRWFGCRVEAAPVVYVALEGEAGFALRAKAWEVHRGRALPDGMHMVLQPFKLTEPQDVQDLASEVPAGAVVFLDTLNRAAPTADENSSRDMGEILEAAKRLQSMTWGLVVLIHHTGKDAAKGLRGHSSLFAALDAAIEVSRDGDRREWRNAKVKDGPDGDAHSFRLEVETLGVDADGEPITSCIVRADESREAVQRVKLPQGGNQRIALDAMRPLFKSSVQSGKPGAPTLRPCIELDAAIRAVAAALPVEPDRKTERARAAITGLISRGVLGCNEGWLWQT